MPKVTTKNKGLSGPGLELQAEAMRYINNAREIFNTKAKQDERGFYQDKKYVKMASHTAYTGVLLAIETALNIKAKKADRLSKTKFTEALSKENKKMNTTFEYIYHYLHLEGSYDGIAKATSMKDILKDAVELINWCASRVGEK